VTISLRPASASDAEAVARLVDDAYRHYVGRIGGRPGPMQADYARVIATRSVTVASEGRRLIGVLVTNHAAEDLVIENVAVHPSFQRRGLGRRLLDHAEGLAAALGVPSVRLWTHELMSENLAHYSRRGYVEYDRESLPDGSHLVLMRKELSYPA
jgi:GNAT superfamily N-acetyltransferase